MGMLSVRLTLPQDAAEAFADLMLEQGALSVSVEDAQAGTCEERPLFGEPGATPGLWQLCDVSALFDAEVDVTALIEDCATQLNLKTPAFKLAPVEEVDWVQANRDQFKPLPISERLWIVPSWHAEAPLPQGALPILIDPGAAFGTGSHPTTRLCLRWLEAHLDERPGSSVLDYGCGSGILAIAAAKLGASRTTGIDIDEIAIETARHNALQNGVTVEFQSASTAHRIEADLVVANILSHPLIMLAPLLASSVKPGGRLALSGILDTQAEEVIAAYVPWLRLSIARQDEDWVCLSGERA